MQSKDFSRQCFHGKESKNVIRFTQNLIRKSYLKKVLLVQSSNHMIQHFKDFLKSWGVGLTCLYYRNFIMNLPYKVFNAPTEHQFMHA